MTDLLFDTPWWLPVAIAAVGVMLFLSGNRRQQSAMRNAGVALFGLAILVVLLTVFVDTPKKIARRESTALVQAAVAGDWAKFQSLLTRDADLRLLGSQPMYDNAGDLTAAAKAGAQSVHLREAHVRSLHVDQGGDVVTTSLELLTEQDEAAAPLLDSSWQFDFEKGTDGWRIREIRALNIGQMDESEAVQRLPRSNQ
jgi:hypothetical protein